MQLNMWPHNIAVTGAIVFLKFKNLNFLKIYFLTWSWFDPRYFVTPIFHFHQLRKVFKFNLLKIEIVQPGFEPRTFGMAAMVADHKATVDMCEMRVSMSRMVAPHKHSFV
jgi:hypothetical protein